MFLTKAACKWAYYEDEYETESEDEEEEDNNDNFDLEDI